MQVIHYRVTDLLGQRQTGLKASLSTYPDRGFFPIDIVETKLDDISRPKPHTGQEEEYRAISFANRGAGITGGDDPLHVPRQEVARKRGKTPVRHHGNGSFKRIRACAFGDEKTKKHAKGRCVSLCCCPSGSATRLQHELSQTLCIEAAGIVSQTREQCPDRQTVIGKGRIRSSTLLFHPLPERDEQGRFLGGFDGGGQ